MSNCKPLSSAPVGPFPKGAPLLMKQRKEEMEPPPFSLGLAALHVCYSMENSKQPALYDFAIFFSENEREREREKHAEIIR